MEEIKFLVQGSADVPYEVTFRMKEGRLTARCTCTAGDAGQACKHRLAILNGHIDGIVSDNAHEVHSVSAWLPESDIATALEEIRIAENKLADAKSVLSEAKRHLGAVMLGKG